MPKVKENFGFEVAEQFPVDYVPEPQAKTFKPAATPTKEYHYMQRIVGPMAMPDGTITGEQLEAEVMYWLGSGYALHTTHYYGDHKGSGGEFIGRVVAYHFVKG